MRRTPLPPDLVSTAFTVARAHGSGVSDDRLAASDLVAPFRGVRVPVALGEIADVEAYAPRLTYGQFFSHATAARLHGLPVPSRIPATLHVTAVQPVRAPRFAGVVAHHIQPARASVVTVDGIRVADPVAAWISLAPLLTTNELIVMGDALLRRHHPLASLDHLERMSRRFRGARGARRIAAALATVRPRTDSVQESWLRIRVMAAGLPEPRVNPPVFAKDGSFIGFADLYWPDRRVILEYDGEQHRTDEGQYLRDIDRLEAFMAAGNRVVRANRSHQPWFRVPIARVAASLLPPRVTSFTGSERIERDLAPGNW